MHAIDKIDFIGQNEKSDLVSIPLVMGADEICRGCSSLDFEGECERFRECGRYRAWFFGAWRRVRRLFGKGERT